MRWLFLLCALLFTAGCEFAQLGFPPRADDPVALTVEARRTEAAIATAVEATLAADSPALIIPDVQSLSLRIEAEVEGNGRSGSFFGGEAIFRARDEGQIPDIYLRYRMPDFATDSALLVLDGTSYNRQSPFSPWVASPIPLELPYIPGMTPAQTAATLLGFTFSLDQWERVGAEMLDGRETDRYRRTYQPENAAWRRVVGLNFAGVERVDLDLWVSSADSLPRRLQLALLARFAADEAPTLIRVTIDVAGYNEPVTFPSPD